MRSSTANQIITPPSEKFFLSPQFPLQRQYEALRAYFVEEEASGDVARRFGYSRGAFRVLCHQFRHNPDKRASFFRQPQRGPQSAPARDRVRALAIAMRKRNLSVYDMQRELAAAGHTISINSLDSQLTTYHKLAELHREGICFITLRRRSRQMLREIYSQPDSAWRRISLPALTRIYRNPKVLEQRVTLPGYEGELRQLTVMELGHEEPTILLTNHRKLGPVELVTRYAQRMLIENGISEAVQFFHIDALSSMVGTKVDFDMQLTLVASALYRMMAQRIGREYRHSQAKTVFRNLLNLSGKVEVTATSVVVTLDKRAHNPYLVASGLTEQPTSMPWFGGKKLIIRFA